LVLLLLKIVLGSQYTGSSSILSQNQTALVDMFKRGTKSNHSACSTLKSRIISGTPSVSIMPEPKMSAMIFNAPDVSKFTVTAAKDAFTYVLENALKNENVTRALEHEGIDNIISSVRLTDDIVDKLAYHDPNPNKQKLQKLKIGEIGLLKSFIQYVYFREETNPIGNDWKSVTKDDFDQFRANFTYTRRFHPCCLCHHLI
jgi:hypothetical protein